MAQTFNMSPDAISCLRVPFDVAQAPVQVGSIFAYEPVDIPMGRYSLIYEVLPGQGTWDVETDGEKETGDIDHVIKLWFLPNEADLFEILKTGGAVLSGKILSRLSALA